MVPRVILITLLAASFPLAASTVYWASTSNIDYSALGGWLTLTGYALDLKTTAPENGSDPVLIATVDAYQGFVAADRKIPGDRLLAMRQGFDANADLCIGPEFVTGREPRLTAQAGAAPNAGTLGIAADGGVYSGANGGWMPLGFGPLTISNTAVPTGDLQAGRNDSPDALIAAFIAAPVAAPVEDAGAIRATDAKASDQK